MSTPNRQFYTDQTLRMSGLNKFPFHPEAISELINVLIACTRSEQHAKLTIEAVLDSDGDCPTPKALKRFANETPAEAKGLSAGCEKCGGKPWVHVERGDAVAVARCACPRGQQLAAADLARAAGKAGAA